MLEQTHILVIDDDQDILVAAKLLLKRYCSEVDICNTPESIPKLLASKSYDAVLLDMNFSPGESSGKQGFNWLKRIRQIDSDAVVIMITAHAGIDIAVEAMKHGATDFIAKPWQNEKVLATLSAAVQLHQSRSEASRLKLSNQALTQASNEMHQTMIGSSAAMQQVLSVIRRTAATDANVLILGENGTGKELVARELHQQSDRQDQVFMSVDMGAVADNLFESELFGHKKGAFTGADKDKLGLIQAANGGTLFLDEIGNIPLRLQAKLLTVLEQRKLTPLGSTRSHELDIRVLAATNMSRADLYDASQFRQDLLFRLNTVEISLPKLCERSEDIAQLAAHYIEFYCKKYRQTVKRLSEEALVAMQSYHWPGNIRALRHCIERAIILSDGHELTSQDLQLKPELSAAKETGASDQHAQFPEELNLERAEQRLVEAALQRHGFNISKAAKELGITRASLYRRMEKYGV